MRNEELTAIAAAAGGFLDPTKLLKPVLVTCLRRLKLLAVMTAVVVPRQRYRSVMVSGVAWRLILSLRMKHGVELGVAVGGEGRTLSAWTPVERLDVDQEPAIHHYS